MVAFNNRLRQIILLAVIILLAYLLLKNLYVFLPGVLGAITLYMLSREGYFRLTIYRGWRKTWTALLYIFAFLIIIILPVYYAVMLLSPRISNMFNNPVELLTAVRAFSDKISGYIGMELLSDQNIAALKKWLANIFPKFLTGTANLVSNLLIMFFTFYYMLVHGKKMENYLNRMIPLKVKNVEMLGEETKLMIKANAIGIPVLAVIQGLVGALGYWIFGLPEVGVWGFLTGVCSLIPIVGTGIIWVPLTVYLVSTGHTWQGLGLGIYSLVVLTNIDYVARLTLLRKLGDVHPLITIFGVIIGLNMFGFLGVIFGPLLLSYFIVLVKIYMNEFKSQAITPMHDEHTPVH